MKAWRGSLHEGGVALWMKVVWLIGLRWRGSENGMVWRIESDNDCHAAVLGSDPAALSDRPPKFTFDTVCVVIVMSEKLLTTRTTVFHLYFRKKEKNANPKKGS